MVFDPQTSGGLLIFVSQLALSQLLGHLAESSVPAFVIGTVSLADPAGTRIRFFLTPFRFEPLKVRVRNSKVEMQQALLLSALLACFIGRMV